MASNSSRRRQDAPRPIPGGARLHVSLALVIAAVAVVVGAAAVYANRLNTTGRTEGVPAYVAAQLGAARSAARPAAGVIHARVAGAGATARIDGHSVALAPLGTRAHGWQYFEHGAVRTTAFGHEAVTTSAGAFEEFTTVDRRHGRHTWRWRISSSTLEPSVEADGSVALLTGGQRSGLVIAPATILDGHGQSVTPAGTSWSVRRAGKGWLLQLVLDDAALPVPYTIDPAVSVVTFAGTPQTGAARSNWTVGFKTGGSGNLAAGDTITIVFNPGFTLPATPSVTLLTGFANCSATATATGTTATVTLANSAGTCALGKSTSATLRLSRLKNPAAGTLTGTTFSVATSQETTPASPANVTIAAATAPTAVSFSGSPQTGAARSTWTVGFTASATGALTTGDSITVAFPGTFTIPALPTITLTGAYSNCSATGAGAGTTVTITLADNAGTCTLANSASGALKITFPTNPAAGSIAAASWSVKTGTDTSAANPAAPIAIAGATSPSAVSFAGSPQTGAARSTWTVGLTTSATGALTTGDTITATFNAGFAVPATPTIQLTSGFTNCAAAGTAAGTTVTVTLANNAGTCAVANSAALTFKVLGVTNPAPATLTNTTFTAKTSTDTNTASPAGNVTIAAATNPSSVTFSGSPQTGTALATWTVGFTTTATGALTTGDTITVAVNSGFSVPATPIVALTGGFVSCTASATASAQTVTVTLSGASCVLAASTPASLTLRELTNPSGGSLANTTFSVKTSTDTAATNPASAVVINAATAPSAVSFAASTRSAGATATWTVGFTTSSTGSLDLGDAIVVVLPAGFTVPATPTITLSAGFVSCSASATSLSTTVTIQLADNAGTCALAGSLAGSLAIAGITNAAAGTYAASSFTVKSTTDTVAANSASAIDIFGAASKLAFTTQPGGGTAGVAWSTQPAVTVQDSGGRTVANDNSTQVTLAITSGVGGEGFACTTNPVTASSGVATFAGCKIDKAGTYTLDATKAGLTTGTSASLTILAAAAQTIAVNAGDGQSATVNTNVATAPSVLITDAFGNPVSGTSVTFAVGSGGGSLTSGSASSNASGIATVGSWKVGTTAGVGNNTLTATSAALTGSPRTFTANATAGLAASIALNSGNGQSATVNTNVATAPSVLIRDQYGNPVAGSSVTFAVGGGGGSVTGGSASSNASGIATVGSWKLGTASGANSLTATSPGLTGSPLTFNATATAGVATTLSLSAPGSATAGSSFSATVTALDAYGNTATAYAGTVHFSGGGSGATLPADYTFTGTDNGSHTYSNAITLTQAGNRSLTATDTLTATITGNATLTINPAPAAMLSVAAPPSATAGSAFSVTVTALDAYGNTATAYAGTVHLSGGGSGATLPADYTLTGTDNGSHTYSNAITLTQAGNRSVSATDTLTATITGSASVTVTAAALDAAVSTATSAPASVTADGASNSTVTVTANDAFGNPVAGAATSLSQGSGSSIVAPASATTNGSGQAVFTVIDTTAETVAYQATVAGALVTQTATVQFVPGAADTAHTTIGAGPASIPADGLAASTITVRAKDAFGNTLTTSGGAVTLSSDHGTLSPVTDHNDGTYTATLTSSTSVETATITGSIGGNPITDDATVDFTGVPSKYLVTASDYSPHVGDAVTITAQLADQNGVPTGVAGNVVTWSEAGAGGSFGSATSTTDASGTATVTFTAGTTAGTVYAVTATDDTMPSNLTGTSPPLSTTAGTVAALAVSAPASTTAGSPMSVTVTAEDQFGNTVGGYAGTVHFSGGGSGSSLPADYTFGPVDNGSHTFTNGVTLTQAGNRSVIATDTVSGSLTGSASSTVYAAAASALARNAGDGQSGTVGASIATAPAVLATDAYGNPVSGVSVAFSVSAGGGSVTGGTQTTNSSGIATVGSWTLGTTAGPGNNALTASASGLGGSPATFTASATPDAVQTLQLSAPGAATAGVGFGVTVTAADQFGNVATTYAGTVHFSGGGTASTLPADYTFMPGDNGAHSFPGGAVLTQAGNRTISATDTVSGSVTGTASVTLSPASLDAALAEVSASPGPTTADGSTSATVTVTALDAFSNPISGLSTSLGQGTGSSIVSPSSTLTDAAGHAVFTVTDTRAETVTYEPSVGGTLLAATADQQFVPGAPDHLEFLVDPNDSAAGQTIAPAVEVQIVDLQGNLTAATATVSLTVDGGATLGGTTSRAASAGVAVFGDLSVAQTASGYRLHATSGTLTAADSASFAISAAAVDAGISGVVATPASVSADGSAASTVTVSLKDAAGNPVAGKTVSLAQPGGRSSTISAPSGPSDAAGHVSFDVTNTTAETVPYTATDTTDAVTVTQTASVTFVDTVPPAIGLGGPPDGVKAAGTFSLSATGVGDPGSGVHDVTFWYCDSTSSSCAPTAGSSVAGVDGGSGTWTGALDTAGLADGHAFTWLAVATDNTSNATTTVTRTFSVDNTQPVLGLAAPASGAGGQFYEALTHTLWLNGSDTGDFRLNATATDPQSGIARVRFSALLGTGAHDVTGGTSSFESNPYVFSPGSNSGTVGVTAFNNVTAGSGAGTANAAFTIAADSAPPNAFSLGSPSAGATVRTGVTVSAAPTDVGSGLRSVDFAYCDRSVTPLCAPSIAIGATQTIPVLGVYSVSWSTNALVDGHSYAVAAIASDNVGETTASLIDTVVVDNSAPAVGVATPLAVTGSQYQSYDSSRKTLWLNPAHAGSFKLAASAADPDSGIGSVTFPDLFGSGANPGSHTASSTYESTATYAFSSPTAQGLKTVAATNGVTEPSPATSTDSLSVDVDGAVPSNSVTFPLDNGAYDNLSWQAGCATAGLCGNVADGASGVRSITVSIEDRSTGRYFDGSSFTQPAPTPLAATVVGTSWSFALDQTALTAPHAYEVEVTATDNVDNAVTGTPSRFTFGSDVGAPNSSLTLAGAAHAALTRTAAHAYNLYYGTSLGAGGFTLHAVSTDPSGVATLAFPNLTATGGFGGSGGTASNAANDDPYTVDSPAYTFSSGATTPPGPADITSVDVRGNSGDDTLTFLLDNAAPTGGSLGVGPSDANGYATSTSLTVTHADYTADAGSGVASSALTVATAALTGGTCGTFGSESAAADGQFTATDAMCYRYTLTGADRVGNTSTVAQTVKVDTTAPTQPGIVFGGLSAGNTYDDGSGTLYYRPSAGGTFTITAAGSTDPESGIAAGNAGYDFAALAGFTGTTQTGSSLAVTFDGSSSGTGSHGVHATDNAGLDSGTASYAVAPDSTAPAGGGLTANGTAATAGGSASYFTSGAAVAIASSPFADAGSGMASDVVTVESAPLANDTCGSFGSPATITGSASYAVSNGNCYRFTITATDHVGNTSALTTTVEVDTTPPTQPTVSFTGLSAGNTFASGTTLFFRPSAGGTFTVDAGGAADPETGLKSGNAGYSFSALSGFLGATQTGNAVAVTFDGASNGSGGQSVSAINRAGIASTAAPFTVAPDSGAPVGGLLSIAPYSSSTTVAIATTDFTDAGSGIASNAVTRSDPQAPVSGSCPASGYTGATVVAGAADAVPADGACYRYTLTGVDRVGNRQTFDAITLVDTTGPAGGSLSYVDGLSSLGAIGIDWTSGTDSESGIASVQVERATASLAGSTCGSFGPFATLGGPATTSPIVDSSVVAGTCYAYRVVVTNNAGVPSTFSSPAVAKLTNSSPITVSPGNPAGVYLAGTTLYLGPASATVPFRLELTTLGRNGVDTATWSGRTGSLSSAPATDAVTTSAPFQSGAYTWDGTAPLSDSILVTRDPGATSDSLSVVSDTTPPTGTISYPNATLTSHSVPVTASGSDGGSGVSGVQIERSETTLTGTTCGGTWSAFASVTLTGGNDTTVADNTCYRYQAVVTDNVGNTSALGSANVVQIPDVTPPTFVSAATNVAGTQLAVTMSEPLDGSATTPAGAFTIAYDGVVQAVPAGIAVSGPTVTLDLAAPPSNSQAVTLRYSEPAAAPDRIRDNAVPTNNETASFGPVAVVNATPDTTAPSVVSSAVDASTLMVRFDENLSGVAPDASAFTVTTGSGSRSVSNVAMSGNVVTLTLSTPVTSADAVDVSYSTPALNALRDAAANAVAPFARAAANQTPTTTPPSLGSGTISSPPPVLAASTPDDGSTVRTATTIALAANATVTWTNMTVTHPDGSVTALIDGAGQDASWPVDGTPEGLYAVRGTISAGGRMEDILSYFTVYRGGATVPPVKKNAVPAAAGRLTSPDGRSSIAWPAGAFADAAVVELAPTPAGAWSGVPADSTVVDVTAATRPSGDSVKTLDGVVDISFPDAAPGGHATTSQDGKTWREIPQLATLELPDGQLDGWFRDSDQAVHVLTRHLTYYALAGQQVSTKLVMRIVTPRRLWLEQRAFVAVRVSLTAPARVTGSFVASDGSTVAGQSIATPTRRAGATLLRLPLKITRPGLYKLQLRAAGLGQTADRTATIRFLRAKPASPVWQDGPPRVAVVQGAGGLASLGRLLGRGFVVEQVADSALYDAVDTNYRTAAAAVVVDLGTIPRGTLAGLHALLPEVKIVGLAPEVKRTNAARPVSGVAALLPRHASPALVARTVERLLRR